MLVVILYKKNFDKTVPISFFCDFIYNILAMRVDLLFFKVEKIHQIMNFMTDIRVIPPCCILDVNKFLFSLSPFIA